MKTLPRGKGGFAADYYGIFYHGVASTHIDALCHTWDDDAMWNGRDPKKEITLRRRPLRRDRALAARASSPAASCSTSRATAAPSSSPQDRPVHGWELDDILTQAGSITLEPGDAVCVYSGREAWQAQDPERPYGKPFGPSATARAPACTSPACRSCATTT